MPINPNIALQFKPVEIEDPLNKFAKMLEIRQMQDTQKMNALNLDAAQRKDALQAQLNQYSATPRDYNSPTIQAEIMSRFGDIGMEHLKQVGELDKRRGDATKVRLENDLNKRMNFAQKVSRFNTPEAMADSINTAINDGEVDAVYGNHLIKTILSNPNRFNEFKLEVLTSALTPKEQVEDVRKGQDLQLDKGRLDVSRGQLALSARTPTVTHIVDPADPTRMLAIDARTYRGGSGGAPGVIGVSGKEPTQASKELKTQEGRESVDTLLSDLKNAYLELDKNGGIVNTNNQPGSNAFASLAATGPGQAAGRIFGTKNQELRNKIEAIQPLLLASIKQATGMSAKQMDSNKELQFFIKSASDPTRDIKTNLETIQRLSELYGTKTKTTGASKLIPPPPDGYTREK
jgi:hypothetical protein